LADDSNQTDVGARYAQALFDLALDNKAVAAVETDLKALTAAFEESADLRVALASPVISDEAKGKVLTAIGETIGFNAITLKLIGVMAANRRASAMPAVIIAFARLSAAHRGVDGDADLPAITSPQAMVDAVRFERCGHGSNKQGTGSFCSSRRSVDIRA
jgi:F-type H+-transporting ATPase subunit delta